jgi:hypothetical protein
VINRGSINHFCYKEELYLYQQDYLYSNLGELLNRHIFLDTSNTVGHVIVELGRAETYLVRCSRGQKGEYIVLVIELASVL